MTYLNLYNLFGQIKEPDYIKKYGNLIEGGKTGGPIKFLNNIIRLIVVVAGIYALLNFVFAGFQFISADGDPKKVKSAWDKIWQSLIGLVIIAASFTLAAIMGQLIFGSPSAILQPKIQGP